MIFLVLRFVGLFIFLMGFEWSRNWLLVRRTLKIDDSLTNVFLAWAAIFLPLYWIVRIYEFWENDSSGFIEIIKSYIGFNKKPNQKFIWESSVKFRPSQAWDLWGWESDLDNFHCFIMKIIYGSNLFARGGLWFGFINLSILLILTIFSFLWTMFMYTVQIFFFFFDYLYNNRWVSDITRICNRFGVEDHYFIFFIIVCWFMLQWYVYYTLVVCY
jgi:hypothetical protein